ncbi:MAG: CorA family divalent cation transporter [bacterium]|nr:CorA family divalent cation transporter [bacterium]
MLSRFSYNNLVWIDLESPTRDEVVQIAEEFGLDTIVTEELLMPSTKPRVEFYESYFYLILHFPALRHSHTTKEQEIDFVLGHNFLITTHYDTIDPLHKFSKILEVNSILDKNVIGDHAGFLLFFILRKLYKAVEHEVEFVRQELSRIEENIFSGHEIRMVQAISSNARDLLNLRQIIEPHREVLHDFEEEGPRFFGEAFLPYVKAISNEYYRTHNHIVRNMETLHELRETNNSLLTTKQNETMRVLTIMALFTFPLALLVAIFDTHTKNNPIIGLPHDFWLIVGTIGTLGFIMFLFFKHKEWL